MEFMRKAQKEAEMKKLFRESGQEKFFSGLADGKTEPDQIIRIKIPPAEAL